MVNYAVRRKEKRKKKQKRGEKFMYKTRNKECRNIKKDIYNIRGITLIALVITIVLNCCEAAMARVNKFEKIKNLMYNM